MWRFLALFDIMCPYVTPCALYGVIWRRYVEVRDVRWGYVALCAVMWRCVASCGVMLRYVALGDGI